ncbi:hypothetical protein D3C87_1371730 [compost metagenome]
MVAPVPQFQLPTSGFHSPDTANDPNDAGSSSGDAGAVGRSTPPQGKAPSSSAGYEPACGPHAHPALPHSQSSPVAHARKRQKDRRHT